jgi:polyisoprenoid-binding protein YceI
MPGRTALAALVLVALGSTTRAADTYQVDPVHSAVAYRVKHLNVSYALGRFNNIAGSFVLDSADPAQSKFDFTVKTDSIDTGNPARDGHLKGPDFFNARQFPTITFKSKSVASAGENQYEVKGDLTLHGVTREVTLKVEKTGEGPGMRGGKLAGLFTEFTLKRSDFGMKNMVGPVGDEVTVVVSVEGGAR